jgi:hypothetical protein
MWKWSKLMPAMRQSFMGEAEAVLKLA